MAVELQYSFQLALKVSAVWYTLDSAERDRSFLEMRGLRRAGAPPSGLDDESSMVGGVFSPALFKETIQTVTSASTRPRSATLQWCICPSEGTRRGGGTT